MVASVLIALGQSHDGVAHALCRTASDENNRWRGREKYIQRHVPSGTQHQCGCWWRAMFFLSGFEHSFTADAWIGSVT
jgi:hypothetical protein